MDPADASRLRAHLEQLQDLRGAAARKPPRLDEVKRWQAARLAQTYSDISSQPRYRRATSFFIGDLYGPKDFSARDEAMLRIYPVMTRILPATAVQTAAFAIELEALSEDLDQRLAAALAPGPITEGSYGAAYRASAKPAERHRQIDLIVSVGERLDALVARPFIARTLKLMRRPAQAARLGDLQDFLERGFDAFREMHGARDFLATIRQREERILSRLFSAAAEPFSV